MISARLIVFCFLLLCVLLVSGHAKLAAPVAFNPQPSTQGSCGISPNAANPQINKPAAVWPSPSTQTITWQVVIGDGVGPLTMKIDTAGGIGPLPTTAQANIVPVQFTGNVPVPNKVGSFTYQVQIPAGITCTGKNKECTFYISSSSNWKSCMSFTTTATATAADTNTCFTPGSDADNPLFTYCDHLNGKSLSLPQYHSPVELDKIIGDTVTEELTRKDLNDSAIILSPNFAGCEMSYKRYYCSLNFPYCPTHSNNQFSSVCQTSCKNLATCHTREDHADLVDCTEATGNIKDSSGLCDNLFSTKMSQDGNCINDPQTGAICSTNKIRQEETTPSKKRFVDQVGFKVLLGCIGVFIGIIIAVIVRYILLQRANRNLQQTVTKMMNNQEMTIPRGNAVAAAL